MPEKDKKYTLQELQQFKDLVTNPLSSTMPTPEQQQAAQDPMKIMMLPDTEEKLYSGQPNVEIETPEGEREEVTKMSQAFNQQQAPPPTQQQERSPLLPTQGLLPTGGTTQGLVKTKPLSKFQKTSERVTRSRLKSIDEASEKKQEIEEQKAGIYKQSTDFLQQSQQEIDRIIDEQAARTEETLEELNSSIQRLKEFKFDPNRYFNNMETPRKILASLALFFGGVGGRDETYQFVMKQLDLDNEAQMAERRGLLEDIEMQKGIYQLAVNSGKSQLEALYMTRQLQMDWFNAQIQSLSAQYQASDEAHALERDTLKSQALNEHGQNEKLFAETYTKMNVKGQSEDVLKRLKQLKDLEKTTLDVEAKEAERSVIISRDPQGKPVTVNARTKEEASVLSKDIKEYTRYRSGMLKLKEMAQMLRKDPWLVTEPSFMQLLLQRDVVGKMRRRIEVTGGGNVSDYEHTILKVFEAFGFTKLGRNKLGQVTWTAFNPVSAKEASSARPISVISSNLADMDEFIKSKITGSIDPKDYTRYEKVHSAEGLLKAYGQPTNYRMVQAKDGRWLFDTSGNTVSTPEAPVSTPEAPVNTSRTSKFGRRARTGL